VVGGLHNSMGKWVGSPTILLKRLRREGTVWPKREDAFERNMGFAVGLLICDSFPL
jgi:hypothetical protein